MVHFNGNDYRSHTSCMSEAQKYQGHLYRGEKKGKGPQQKSVTTQETAIVPRKAYVEDEVDEDGPKGAIAVVDVMPRAPSPPPAASDPPEQINVFDFLVTDPSPSAPSHANGVSRDAHHSNAHDKEYVTQGYSYGNAPVQPSLDRYESWASLHDPLRTDSQSTMPLPPYTTPASKKDRDGSKLEKHKHEKNSDKKRKRHQLDELDMSRVRQSQDQIMEDAPPVLHSGLTGGLSRLLARPVDFLTGPSPQSPLKRNKTERTEDQDDRRKVSDTTHKSSSSRRRHDDDRDDDRGRDMHKEPNRERHRKHRRHRHRDSSSSEDDVRPSRKHVKAIEYRNPSAEPSNNNQVISYKSPAELFMSFVNKGPESERGVSINKALKRYHRERDDRGERDSGDKNLFKELRVRRNERGEMVLFF